MAKKGNRIIVGLRCSDCNRTNYVSERNRINTPDKLELKKYCRQCKKRTTHKEVKKLK